MEGTVVLLMMDRIGEKKFYVFLYGVICWIFRLLRTGGMHSCLNLLWVGCFQTLLRPAFLHSGREDTLCKVILLTSESCDWDFEVFRCNICSDVDQFSRLLGESWKLSLWKSKIDCIALLLFWYCAPLLHLQSRHRILWSRVGIHSVFQRQVCEVCARFCSRRNIWWFLSRSHYCEFRCKLE